MKRILLFLFGIAIICGMANSLLVPNWNYPMYAGNEGLKLLTLEKFVDTDIDVFFVGTSHMEQGVTPMMIYDEQKIVGYNIATGSQPVEGSYYLIEELFDKGYDPKLIIMDASNLFLQETNEEGYRLITNNLKFGKSLIGMAKEYSDEDSSIPQHSLFFNVSGFIFPLMIYHDRWSELNASDFKSNISEKYFLQGYFNKPTIEASIANKESVDIVASMVIQNQSFEADNNDEIADEPQYFTEINEKNQYYMEKIVQTCKDNSCEILLVKIPVMALASDYTSCWSLPRHKSVEKLASQLDIQFLDVLYDTDVDIDWDHDSQDGGRHLNILGAEKVSKFLGEYICDNYDIPTHNNLSYNRKLLLYEEYADVAHIEMSYNLVDYLTKLKNSDRELEIFLSAKDDMISGLSDEEIAALNGLGLKTEFSNMEYNYSFIGVIDAGIPELESVSNRKQDYETTVLGDTVSITSAGYLDGSVSSILINDEEYSMNCRGINIVVYDKKSGLIIDRAVCDTFDDVHEVIHRSDDLLYGFQEYLLGRY